MGLHRDGNLVRTEDRRALPSLLVDVNVAPRTPEDLAAENERLRAQIAQLEHELGAQTARTNEIVASVQERAYWLDRYQLDLNALMAKPGMSGVRTLLRAVRAPIRAVRRLKRRVLGS